MSNNECSECLNSLELYIDGEVNKEQEEYYRNHIEACMPCYKHYNLTKQVKEVLQSKLTKPEVPKDLVANIKDKISKIV
ncbi:MAG: zf-HC2 domain-containing protein [Cytophagaceae bacterium]